MGLVDWMMIIYVVYLICVFFYLISLGLNIRIKHRRYVYNGIASIIERNLHPDNIEKMIDEIENLFDTCCRFYKDLYKVYPNVVFVLDDIHAVINTKIKSKIVNKRVVRFLMRIMLYLKIFIINLGENIHFMNLLRNSSLF